MLFWFNCTLIFLLNGIKKRLKRHFFGVLFGYANMFFIFVSLSRNIISFLKFVCGLRWQAFFVPLCCVKCVSNQCYSVRFGVARLICEGCKRAVLCLFLWTAESVLNQCFSVCFAFALVFYFVSKKGIKKRLAISANRSENHWNIYKKTLCNPRQIKHLF